VAIIGLVLDPYLFILVSVCCHTLLLHMILVSFLQYTHIKLQALLATCALKLTIRVVYLQRKASIEAKNEAETQIYSAESSIREYKDKLPQNVVDNINTEISNVRGSLESEDAEEIRSKVSDAALLHAEHAMPSSMKPYVLRWLTLQQCFMKTQQCFMVYANSMQYQFVDGFQFV